MIDLNTADIADMVEQLGVTIPEAYDLQLWRPYLDWLEVEMTPGFDRDRVLELRSNGAVVIVPGYANWPRPPLRPAL